MIANNDRHYSRLSAVKQVSAVFALGCALAACGKKEDAAPAAPEQAAPNAAAPAVSASNAVSAKVSALSVDQLREAARKAYVENRLYAPAEDNAVEYYLALREKGKGLSTAEKSMLERARGILVSELSFALNVSEDDALVKLEKGLE